MSAHAVRLARALHATVRTAAFAMLVSGVIGHATDPSRAERNVVIGVLCMLIAELWPARWRET